ncbi:MAG: deoxyribodipyrimidine photolyase [Planctomycetota bacterium]|jgi:deoxyribodipyrimidine photo-lyase
MPRVPRIRIRQANDAPHRAEGDFVLYWMIANRRPKWNFALDRALEWAHGLGRPLVVLEALRADYPWACDRFREFITDGMADNARRFAKTNARYLPYLEPEPGAGRGLLKTLAKRACVVVTDDFPCFFLPRMLTVAAKRLPVLLEAVDSNGLLPLRSAPKAFPTAYAFRRFLQKELPAHLGQLPRARPAFSGLPPAPRLALSRWPVAKPEKAGSGGSEAGSRRLRRFLDRRLADYPEDRNRPETDGTSGLSPHLHFGHLSPHEAFVALGRREEWDPGRLAPVADGSRAGWWGMGEAAEAFLDQLITWREVGFNMCAHRADFDRYESLPAWARETLEVHAGDPRPHLYSLRAFDQARTHDELWNAAQRQLVTEGRIHNYLRMLWGKKILEWTEHPRDALTVMIELNNRYALDGRDPNSYSGIFWCLGRYDRAWGPERPIFGKIRYMSSQNTARKFPVKDYVARYSAS